VPTAGEPGGLSAGVVFGERRAVDAEQARQDFWAVGSNRERASRQVARRRPSALRHGREAGSLLAEAQAGHKQTSQSLRNHRPLLKQTDLRCHFDASRILETSKFHQERGCIRFVLRTPLIRRFHEQVFSPAPARVLSDSRATGTP
jgi:hypothetical protein